MDITNASSSWVHGGGIWLLWCTILRHFSKCTAFVYTAFVYNSGVISIFPAEPPVLKCGGFRMRVERKLCVLKFLYVLRLHPQIVVRIWRKKMETSFSALMINGIRSKNLQYRDSPAYTVVTLQKIWSRQNWVYVVKGYVYKREPRLNRNWNTETW